MEYFDVVSEEDKIIGKASRKECHTNPDLIHRAVNIYIFNSPNLDYILRIKRSNLVDTERGKWTILIGEHNKLGEDYETAIKRGVYEEIGIKEISLKKLGDKVIRRMKNQTEIHQNFIGIYEGNIKSFVLDKKEIQEVDFFPVLELLNDVKNNKNSYVSYIESALDVIRHQITK